MNAARSPNVTALLAAVAGLAAYAIVGAIAVVLLGGLGMWLDDLSPGPTYESYGYRPAAPIDPVAAAVSASAAADLATCRVLHGPNAGSVQFPDGQSRCTDKHGRRLSKRSVITVAHEVQP